MGRLVSLDVSGAPRIDDHALWLLFGGHAATSAEAALASAKGPLGSGHPAPGGAAPGGARGVGRSGGESARSASSSFPAVARARPLPKPKAYGGGPRALRHLRLKWCNALTDGGTAAALGQLVGHGGFALETFDAQSCPRLGDETALSLAVLQHELQAVWAAPRSSLKHLNLSGSAVSDYGLVLLLHR
jgi:hypothetical protein